MFNKRFLLAFFLFFVFQFPVSVLWGKVINVPYDYTKIQDALDASSKNDIIAVAAGTYYENLHIKEGRLLLGAGSASTIIVDDGKGAPDAILEISGEAFIKGFTFTGARGAGVGHAVMVVQGSPILLDTNIRDNAYTGLGIHSQVIFTAPLVSGNKIFGNGGAGIATLGKFCKPTIIKNELFNNTNVGIAGTDSAQPRILFNNVHDNGAGVAFKDEANGEIINNQIIGNKLVGINVSRKSRAVIKQNNIMSNGSTGINIDDAPQVTVIKSTIVDNGAEGIFIKGHSKVLLDHNIVSGELPTLVQVKNSEVTLTNNQIYAMDSVGGGGRGGAQLAVIVRQSKVITGNNEIVGGINLDDQSKQVVVKKHQVTLKATVQQSQQVVDKKTGKLLFIPPQVESRSCFSFFPG